MIEIKKKNTNIIKYINKYLKIFFFFKKKKKKKKKLKKIKFFFFFFFSVEISWINQY